MSTPWRLLDWDPATRSAEYHSYDDSAKKTVIRTVQHTQPLLEQNKRLQNDTTGKSPSGDLKHIASLDNTIILLWRQKYGIDVFNPNHRPAVRRLLNSSEWRFLRTSPGSF